MVPFDTAMELYPYVFHPITVVGVGFLGLIHYEWAHQSAARSPLWPRLAGFLVGGVLSLVPTAAFMLATGRGVRETTRGNAWEVDALVAGGLFVVAGTVWGLWRHYEWGEVVPDAAVALAAVTVPYAALSPFWNVSGHVVVALMPTLFLALVDRRFWPTLAIPVVMVPNRIYLDAHTWPQVIGGFLIAGGIVLALYRRQRSDWPGRGREAAA